jgi:hypothetical protein
MWNQIRGTPYIGVRDGQPSFLAPDYQSQFGVETQIIGFLCKRLLNPLT